MGLDGFGVGNQVTMKLLGNLNQPILSLIPIHCSEILSYLSRDVLESQNTVHYNVWCIWYTKLVQLGHG
jgi:hypothetical protein